MQSSTTATTPYPKKSWTFSASYWEQTLLWSNPRIKSFERRFRGAKSHSRKVSVGQGENGCYANNEESRGHSNWADHVGEDCNTKGILMEFNPTQNFTSFHFLGNKPTFKIEHLDHFCEGLLASPSFWPIQRRWKLVGWRPHRNHQVEQHFCITI